MKKLVVGAAALSAAMCGFAMVGPKDYVRDGLVALYDGVYNAKDASGAMTHDPAATCWANLVLGTGDIALPDTAVIADGSVTLPSVTASAPDCSCARTSPITLEACVLSTTAATGNEKAFLTIPGRALVGYDGRSYGITVAAINGVNWGVSAYRYYYSGSWSFQPYASSVHVISYASTINNAGALYADGVQLSTPTGFYTGSSVAAPTGELMIGNATVDYTYHCVRVYSRALTADEAKLNAAIDAVRYQNADPATVSLPEGWSFDDETNLVSTAWAGQHRLTESGSVTFTAPHAEAKTLVNAAFGPVTLDESAQAKDADHAISFVGFDAIEQTTSLFKGGWWDFGAGDFFSSTSLAGHRTTVFDGAVVTNVGTVHVAGTGGADNRIDLVNGAEFHPAEMTLGWKNGANQRSKVTVAGGSLLSVAGKLNMSDTVTQCKQITLSGNELVVSNAGSRLVVGGTFGMAQTSTEGTYGATGGNTLLITDNAVADLQNVNVSLKNGCNVSNRVTVSKGAQLTTEKVSCSTDASYSGFTTGNWNTFEVLDGGVWTNKGTFQMGQYQHANHVGNTLLVSNATFHSKFIGSGSGNTIAWFSGKEQRIIISGPQAKFTVEGSGDASLLFNESAAHDCELIVENGADWTLGPVTRYVYMGGMTRCALVARSGGVFRSGTSLSTGSASKKTLTCQAKDCALRVESDGTFILPSFTALGLRGQLLVDDGRLMASGTVKIGNYKVAADSSWSEVGSNCVMRLKGTHPVVTAATVMIEEKTENGMVFDLPATGYLETHACSTQAVVTASTKIAFGSLSTLTLNGAEELAAHQEEVRKNAKYVLLSAPTLTIPDEVLAAAQATLPERCKLLTRTVEGKKELVLAVSAGLGLTLIVR